MSEGDSAATWSGVEENGGTRYAGAEIAGALADLGLDVRRLPEPAEATPEALQAAVRERSAVLLRGLVGHWPAIGEWTPSTLAGRHGEVTVQALMNLPSTGVLFPKEQAEYEYTLTFADFLKAVLSTSPEAPCYLAYQRVLELLPEQDYDFGSLLCSMNTASDTRAWIGSAGTRSMLHSDLKDNLFCQIWGEKHVTLVSWQDSPFVYPFPDNVVNSRLDLADVDLDSHPLLRKAVLYSGTLGPGDLLFIPRGWWHDIRSVTPSVSLNHWFGSPLGARDYLGLVARLGPRCWYAVTADFIGKGLLNKRDTTNFFFTPSSTGKRLFDALRWRDFSRGNDPSK